MVSSITAAKAPWSVKKFTIGPKMASATPRRLVRGAIASRAWMAASAASGSRASRTAPMPTAVSAAMIR